MCVACSRLTSLAYLLVDADRSVYDGGESHARERQLDARLRSHERDAVWQARGQQRYALLPLLLRCCTTLPRLVLSSLSQSPLS